MYCFWKPSAPKTNQQQQPSSISTQLSIPNVNVNNNNNNNDDYDVDKSNTLRNSGSMAGTGTIRHKYLD